MLRFKVLEPFLHLHCDLAESPYWEPSNNVLRFVDIVNKNVYRVSLTEGPGSLQKQQYEHSISITADVADSDDSFIFGGKFGVGIAKKGSSETQLIQSFWTDEEERHGVPSRMRANDGAVDSRGRFWVSALCDPAVATPTPEGVLFRLDLNGHLQRMITGVTIPNGMSWSKDNRILYFTDTASGTIYAYDFDEEAGSISNRRVFFKVQDPSTGPDGHTQDEDGNLWVAIWGAWKVVRLSPEGQVTAEISVPTRCVTAVAFAEDAIYITSEAEKEPEKYPESVRYQGCVFKCSVGTRGRLQTKAIVRSQA